MVPRPPWDRTNPLSWVPVSSLGPRFPEAPALLFQCRGILIAALVGWESQDQKLYLFDAETERFEQIDWEAANPVFP